MKNMKLARIIALSILLLTAQTLPLTNSVISTAQSQTTSPNLDGTQWKARFALKPAETVSSNYFAEYVFGKQRKVTYKYHVVSEISVIYTVPYGNSTLPPNDPRTLGGMETKKSTSRIEYANFAGEGTYTLKGNMIHLKFSDHIIDAKIIGDTMDGIFNLGDGQRSIWNAERVSATDVKPPASKINNELNLNPTSLDDYQKRGDERLKSKDYQGAISDYSTVIQRCVAEKAEKGKGITDDGLFCYSFSSKAYLNRGFARLNLEDYQGAISDYSKIIQICSCVEGAGICDNELMCYQDLVPIENAYFIRGKAKFKLDDKGGACADLRIACKKGHSDACKIVEVVCN